MTDRPQVGMKVKTIAPVARGQSAEKWVANEKERQGVIIARPSRRWLLVEFQGKLGTYREAFFPMDLTEVIE